VEITPMSSSHDGVSFMVHKLGTEVGPLKQVRELVVNGIEAIEAYRKRHPEEAGYDGRVDVVVDRYYKKAEGAVHKIAFADNGIGMDDVELRKYFNSLSETGKQQGIDKNFGVGAKISTAAWNPYGVEIRSWKNAKGHLVRLVHDEATDRYGLEVLDAERGLDCLDVDDIEEGELLKPDWIRDHGTVVVLLGRDANDDTTLPPVTADIVPNDYWLAQILNRQFFELPKGVTLRAAIESRGDGEKSRANIRKIQGYKFILDKFAVAKGTVDLDNARAHWWILDESRKDELSNQRFYYHAFSGYKNHGHVAAIFRDELFDFTSHAAAIPVLQRFGIVAGYNRVAIYVEPKQTLAVVANLTRTSLVLPDGTSLPWARWADDFYNNMPPQLAEYVERQQRSGATSEDEYVKREIRKYKEFLRVKQIRPNPKSSQKAEADLDGVAAKGAGAIGKKPVSRAAETGRSRPTLNLKVGANERSIEDAFLAFEPRWKWVKADEAMLKDRAARFTHERQFLEINEEFSVLRELVDFGLSFLNEPDRERHQQKVESIARQVYAVQLIWVVMSAMASFRNRESWRGEGFEKLVSQEALTAAVLPRVHLLNEVKRQVRGNPTMKRDLVQASEDADAA
jgi:hypothetical protein